MTLSEAMRLPRQSLFDALNIETGKGLKIAVDTGSYVLPYYIQVVVGGNTVASLDKGDEVLLDSGSFTLTPDHLTDDYESLWKAFGPDGSVVGSGTLDGTPVEISGIVSEFHIYGSLYGDYPASTDFTVGYAAVGGIFTVMHSIFPGVDYLFPEMDLDYLTSHSGTKAISNAVRIQLFKDGEDVTDVPMIKTLSNRAVIALCNQIAMRFGEAWDHIYEVLQAEYHPLENYNMTEETKPDTYDQDDIPVGWQRSTTRSVNQDVTVSELGAHDQTDVYGFNSSNPVPASKVTKDYSVNTAGDKDDNYETVVETEVTGRKTLHKGSVKVERSGNIGVTTTQQMAEAEIQLRIKNHMEDIIFADVDQILTTAGYAPILSKTLKII